MGKYDKDRYQKELSLRFCLASGLVPFIEVIVSSASDLSDSVEILTDLDVVGIGSTLGGGLRRTLFDCKTTGKLSPINRAFWASGVCNYSRCDEAFVVLKNRAVHNHRVSALAMNIDLHDDSSLIDLGSAFDPAFNSDLRYQSSIDRWNAVFDAYYKNTWSSGVFNIGRNVAPISQRQTATYRSIIAELRSVRGHFDPAKDSHVGIFFDVLAGCFVLWASMARDARRFFDPQMSRDQFNSALLYYLWGGKDAFLLRKELRSLSASRSSKSEDYPGWTKMASAASLLIDAPHMILDCANLARDYSIKLISGTSASHENILKDHLAKNNRFRQFCLAISDHLVVSSGLPADTLIRISEVISGK